MYIVYIQHHSKIAPFIIKLSSISSDRYIFIPVNNIVYNNPLKHRQRLLEFLRSVNR